MGGEAPIQGPGARVLLAFRGWGRYDALAVASQKHLVPLIVGFLAGVLLDIVIPAIPTFLFQILVSRLVPISGTEELNALLRPILRFFAYMIPPVVSAGTALSLWQYWGIGDS